MRARFINKFQQGGNPLVKMGVGIKSIANSITTRDLNIFHEIFDGEDFDYIKTFFDELSQKHYDSFKLLKNYIDFDNSVIIDITDSSFVQDYINKNSNGRFIYDLSNSDKNYWILFSKIELPNAKPLKL